MRAPFLPLDNPPPWQRRLIRRLELVQSLGGCCAYCDRPLLADLDTFLLGVLDHVKPRYYGGPDAMENRALACNVCDWLKGNSFAATVEEARELVARRRAAMAELFLALKGGA